MVERLIVVSSIPWFWGRCGGRGASAPPDPATDPDSDNEPATDPETDADSNAASDSGAATEADKGRVVVRVVNGTFSVSESDIGSGLGSVLSTILRG